MARGVHIVSHQPCEGILFFEPPCKPRKPWNWLGIMGMLTSIFGFVTFGLLSPLGLVLSLLAMRRGPRTAATLGTVFGGVGTAFVLLMVYLVSSGVSAAREAQDVAQTQHVMAQAVAQVDDYYHQNETLPEGIDGNKLLISAELSDAWGESLRYDRLEGERFHVRSAGPDREFDTADDLTRS